MYVYKVKSSSFIKRTSKQGYILIIQRIHKGGGKKKEKKLVRHMLKFQEHLIRYAISNYGLTTMG